jgi:hypothetical protein
MADIETLEDVVVNEDPVAQMSVVPLATRMRMASEDNQLQRPKYYHMDDALRMSYDDIMSKQTDTQLAFKRGAEAKTTSDTGEIIRSTVENYIVNALNKPEKAVLAIGNIMTVAGSTVGKDWANWANESINDFVENNYASQRAGDAETWAAKITGGVLSGVEYMGLGMVSSPLASVSMGVDILGDATKNDIDRYIAETGDKSLANYKADWRDVGINFLNTGAQLYIEDKLGFGKVLKAKTHGASEFLSGFAQEFFQGEIGDIAEAAKGNKTWRDVWTNVLSNVKDGVVGSFLQGSLGLAAHHHYASVAENQMKDFFVETGMDEKAAQKKAHQLRLKLENEVAPLVAKQDKEIYDLVMKKGAVWGQIYDSVYSGMRLVDSVMTEEELRNKATEVADNVATQVIESVVKNGTDLSETMIGFNPVDKSIYVNDKKTLNITQALEEIKALDEKPATKEDVKQAIAEEKKAEETKKAEQAQPVQAIKPDALFNQTKQKAPEVKQLQLALDDGSIKLTRAENVRYQNLLRDKHNGKPTTNEQMSDFANKMLDKYAPVAQGVGQPAGQVVKQTIRIPEDFTSLDEIYPVYKEETVDVDGVERTVYNSDGKRIAKSKEALVNFWRWFSNSKVVDEQGRPLIVYHGALGHSDLIEISPEFGLNVRASYFSDNKDIASHYSESGYIKRKVQNIEKKIEEAKTIDNILDVLREDLGRNISIEERYTDEKGTVYGLEDGNASEYLGYKISETEYESDSGKKTDIVEKLKKQALKLTEKTRASDLYAVYLSLQNPLIVDAQKSLFFEVPFNGEKVNTETIISFAQNNNYDGVIVKDVYETNYANILGTDYITFAKNQIKNIENSGLFSNNNNMYDTLSDAEKEQIKKSLKPETTELPVKPAKPNKYDAGAKKASKMSETLKQNAPAELAEEMVQEMDGEYNQRMTKNAVTDAVNFALSSEENMDTAVDAVLNMKEVDGIKPYEMYAGLMIIATKYNHPLLFEQLRNSPIHQGLARQAGQDISALQFTTESGMINVMKVVDSLDQNIMTKENKETVEKNVKELRNVLNEIDYLDPETIEAIESLEC